VQLLINASAFIDMADKDGFTALSLAGKEGQSGCVRLLLDARASTTTFCNFGTSPLLAAVLDACTDCVRQLLDAGAQIDHRNQYGATALHLRPSYLPFHTTRTVSQLVCPTKTVSAVLDYFCSVARASTPQQMIAGQLSMALSWMGTSNARLLLASRYWREHSRRWRAIMGRLLSLLPASWGLLNAGNCSPAILHRACLASMAQ
jgi:hypothetical protein